MMLRRELIEAGIALVAGLLWPKGEKPELKPERTVERPAVDPVRYNTLLWETPCPVRTVWRLTKRLQDSICYEAIAWSEMKVGDLILQIDLEGKPSAITHMELYRVTDVTRIHDYANNNPISYQPMSMEAVNR